MNYKKIILLTTISITFFSIPTFADNTFLSDLNDTIDSAQETINKTVENLNEAGEVIGGFVEDTKEVLSVAVETIKVMLSDLDNHWAKQYVEELVSKHIISGYPDGTFKPNASISVSEFTKILMAGTFETEEYSSSTPWYQSYVDIAIEKRIIENGEYSDYTSEITRYEMARMIARAGESENKLTIRNTSDTKFKDDADIATEGKKYISAVSRAGIITGYPNGDFGPNKKATRAEASVMLNRFLKLEGNSLPSEPTSIVDQMIANVLDTNRVIPLTYSQVEQLANNTVPYKVPGTEDIRDIPNIIYPQSCIVGNGIIEIADTTNMGKSLSDIVDILAVLAVHAEKNNQMVAVGGGGNGVYIWYGENFETLRRNEYMFSIGFKRQLDWAQEKEFEGKNYVVDREVTIDTLFAMQRLEDDFGSFDEQDKYLDERNDMEEDVLKALYDGLKVFDEDNAEELFIKITNDYKYAKTHTYKNEENNEFFELNGTKIYKDDRRGYGGSIFSKIIYSYIE